MYLYSQPDYEEKNMIKMQEYHKSKIRTSYNSLSVFEDLYARQSSK